MTKCGFCGCVDHRIRECVSEAAVELLEEYRGITTEVALDDFLRRHFNASLSIVMISYGASSISISRMEKINYIRLRWIQELVNPVIAPTLDAPDPAPALAAQAVAPISRRVFLQFTADSIFDRACVLFGGRSEMILAADLYPLFTFIGESIVIVTGDSRDALNFVSKKIWQKFQMARNSFRWLYDSCMTQAFQIAAQIRLNQLLLIPDDEPVVYIPHKPQFREILLGYSPAKKSEEYRCGICGDEHTQETLPTLGCDHTMCYECISGQIKARSKSSITCPFCREEVVQISVQDPTIREQIIALVASENPV